MRKSLLQAGNHMIGVMIEKETDIGAIGAIRQAEHDGGECFFCDFSKLDEKYWNVSALQNIIQCTEKPVSIYTYRTFRLMGKTDDEIADYQRLCMEAGAATFEIQGDLFCPSPNEFATDEAAVRKQISLAEEAHRAGAEVLFSSHTSQRLSTQQAFTIMSEMRNRGADIAKVVSVADTQEAFNEAIETLLKLKQDLGIPFIYLCSGKYGLLFRYINTMLGSLISFTVPGYTELSQGPQPLTEDLAAFWTDMKRHSFHTKNFWEE